MAGKDEIREKGGNLSIPLYVRANNGKGSDATISREQASAHRQERAITSRHSLDGCCTWEKKWTSSHYGVALDTKKRIFLCQKNNGCIEKKY